MVNRRPLLFITDRSFKTGTEWDGEFDQIYRATASVTDVVREYNRGRFAVSHDHLVIVLGNYHIPPVFHDPVRGIRTLAQLVASHDPLVHIYVGGLLPRADDETFLTPLVVEINKSIASMCRLTKMHTGIKLKWIGLSRLLLEKVCYESPISEDTKYHTRIVQPYSTYFKEDGLELNNDGRLKIVKFVLSMAGIKPDASTWSEIPTVPAGVQRHEDLLRLIQCRGKFTKEWEEEDEIEVLLREKDLVIVDECGPSSDDEELSDKKNLKIHLDWSEYGQDFTDRDREEQDWVSTVVNSIHITPPRKKGLGRLLISSSVTTSAPETSSSVMGPEAGGREIEGSVDPSVISESSQEGGSPENSEEESDDLGEHTVVPVKLDEN